MDLQTWTPVEIDTALAKIYSRAAAPHQLAMQYGREFARAFLALVRRFRPDEAPTLLAQYKQRRIRYTRLPQTTTESTSQRAAAR